MIGIYKITSPSGHVYIGQSKNIHKRWKAYKNCFCKTQPAIYNSILKYGPDAHIFEIIHDFGGPVSQEVMDQYELLYWNQYKDLGTIMLNARKPGLRTEEIKTRKGAKTGPKKGYKHPDWVKDKISIGNKGKILSKETREKLSASMKGKPSAWKGKHLSEETKCKLSASALERLKLKPNPFLGKKHTEETRSKISELAKTRLAIKPPSNKTPREIEGVIIDKYINSKLRIIDIAETTGVCTTTVKCVIRRNNVKRRNKT